MAQLIPWAGCCLAALALCWWRPGAGRIFLGLFYLAMAVGVNVGLVLVAPAQFVALGTTGPLVAPDAWFFREVVAAAPAPFGLLLLGRGRQVRWGVAGGVAHLQAITPLGVWTLANPLSALAPAAPLRRDYDRSLLGLVLAGFTRHLLRRAA